MQTCTFRIVVSIYTIHNACNLTVLLNWVLLKAYWPATIDTRDLYGKTMHVNNVDTSLTSSTMKKFGITCCEVTLVKRIMGLNVLA